MGEYLSWGRHFHYEHDVIIPRDRNADFSFLQTSDKSLLPYGLGRSYGDSCLNDGGTLIDMSLMRNGIAFDQTTGVLRAEAGMSFAEILDFAAPLGWFLPVTPGTKFVTLGGAIANDVHGKNHHVAGTIGCHVRCFELLRSDGECLICSPEENTEMFRASIGGLGLTGLIRWAEIQLIPIRSAKIEMESIKFENLEEFFDIAKDSDKDYPYTVAWIDCLARPPHLGRGHFMRGGHYEPETERPIVLSKPKLPLFVPFEFPSFALNSLSIRAFNETYYQRQRSKTVKKREDFNPFFYPLDAVHNWSRIYGKRGMVQYQFVVPLENQQSMTGILDVLSQSGQASFLAVIKYFGDVASPGMLSFPKPGVTLALDFPNRGKKNKELTRRLDDIVMANGGKLYPAKDSFMSAQTFQRGYPQWKDFQQYIDPNFSSSFWRRVTQS